MASVFNSLLFRIGAVFLLAMLTLQTAILAAVLWPDGRPAVFRLIDPIEVAEIADALETVDPAQQAQVLAAINNGATIVELLPGFPRNAGDAGGLRAAPRLEQQFAEFASELEGRELQVQIREGYFSRDADLLQGPIRLLVELRTGQVIAIERAPIVLQTIASRYLAVAGVIAATLAILLIILVWQVVRPVSRLAEATHAFRDDTRARDVPVSGAGELRELAGAFNDMKARISGLVGERTRVLAAIAHDLRTYITRLRLRVHSVADSEQRDKAVADLEEMSQLLDDVLMFARNDAADGEELPVIDAQAAANEYVEIRREAGDPVILEATEGPLYCRCAPLAFRRILSNLIDNAIRYGRRARLRVQLTEDVVLTVDDDGPGIPGDKIEAMTEPFERLEPSRGRRTGGAGLGLSIVKALVESHGGSLVLANRSDGGLRAQVHLVAVSNADD
ncbi:ATP-binding protein [Chelativorans sp. AA-79]|uniref:ATP-binding protein n=1 Tax=Chelativorans sp. AA-79 TaxID=3028735 RepID=UPI0023F6C4F1|nr:ATP-binding protein [Chelativorans sp. AA-79]WEX07975.1 ATP-binding protein [Chelativorans sp. AA-79]